MAAAHVVPARSVATLEKPAPATTRIAKPAGARPKRRRRSGLRIAVAAGVGIGCVAAAGVGVKLFTGHHGQPHTISAPSRLGQFVEAPALATSMGANTLRNAIIANTNGEASHVVDAAYEETSGAPGKSSPVIILFVGGNLSGSAASFIDSLTKAVPGSFMTSPGSMSGQAACIPGQAGHPSECVWADNDTFGVIASPSLTATALGSELRVMRPLVEHAKK